MEYIQIDKTTKEPLYLQIKNAVKTAIINGTLNHMDKLPTERELCEVFDMSVIVAKNAYDELLKEGLVSRIKGKGTFVTTRKTYKVPIHHFYNLEYFSKAAKYELKKRVVLFSMIKYDPTIYHLLHLEVDELCYVAKLVIYLKNEPLLLQTLYLPEKHYKHLNIEKLEQITALEMLQRESVVRPDHIKNVFKAHNLTSAEAQLLKVDDFAPAHYVRSFVYDDQNEPLVLLVSLYPSETAKWEVDLHA